MSISPREITSQPSTEGSAFLKLRYLDAPLMVDIEYIKHLTDSHKRTDGMEIQERRALNHAYALQNLTPVIHEKDLLAGNKTRYIRGAIPYANYASEPFLKEMRKQEQDAQAKHAETGQGGGVAKSMEKAVTTGMHLISGKFLISETDLDEFRKICEYWEGKSFMDQGNSLWRTHFSQAGFIENGWKIGLYTAPHEPCPEGRLILDFEMAINKGYLAIIQDIEQLIRDFQPENITESGKLNFWRSAVTVLKGAIQFAHNYADEALQLAQKETNPARIIELLELADICNHVPMEPPRNFREAVQSFWFTYLLGHLEGSHLGFSPGKLDMLLFPWFDADKNASFEDAVALFEELFVKMTQIEYIASLSWQGLGHGNLYQNLILGGTDENDNPASNIISMAILQAQINMQMTQPTLSVWYDDRLDQAFLMKAAECVKSGVGYPAFFNQKTYIKHESDTSHLPVEVIRKCSAMGGCTEPTLQGMSYGIVQAGFVNHGKIIDLTLNAGADPVTGIRMFENRELNTYKDIRQYYLDIMKAAVRNWQQYWNYVMLAHRNTVPLIFCSVFVRDCIARGQNMDNGGAILNQSITTLSSGLVNVANSLSVIKKLCFEDQVCSFPELTAAVRNNWQGFESLRRKALEVPHWGNDDDYIDSIFLDLFDEYCNWV
ncbi:MAG: hypothetical protein NTV01_01490, partial [Bacteroidia bacterium]|nr:hypothetical protein [Bacteroidia bacterium]